MKANHPYIFLFLILLIYNKILLVNCVKLIIEFSHNNLRAGKFAVNSRGDLVIEYSRNNHRLFFGLKKDGNYFFTNSEGDLVGTKEFDFGEDASNCKRYESENVFVTNNNNGEEYLFTLGTLGSYTALHDLDQTLVKYKATGSFLGDQIFSYRFPLLNITHNGKKEYIVAFLKQKEGDKAKYMVKKFSFSSFTLDSNNMQTNSDLYEISYNNRISSGFIMNNWIVVFFLDWQRKYAIDIYDFDLEWKNKNNIPTLDQLDYSFENDGTEKQTMFAKSFCLRDNYAIFVYYLSDSTNSLKLKVIQITGVSSISEKLSQTFNSYYFQTETRVNELVKMDDERLAFIAMPSW